jgi:hypothetical protein
MPSGSTKHTPGKKARFLAALRTTGGNVSRACEAVRIVRCTAYDWRKADEAFAAQWDAVVEACVDELEQEARRRAFEGVDEPIVYKGEIQKNRKGRPICVRKYSDTLLMFLLNGRRGEVFNRQRHEHTGKDGEPIQVAVQFSLATPEADAVADLEIQPEQRK